MLQMITEKLGEPVLVKVFMILAQQDGALQLWPIIDNYSILVVREI